MFLSKFEKHILSELDLDGAQTISSLARKLSVSRDKVASALDRFHRDSMVTGYTAVIDIGQQGLTGVAVYAKLAPLAGEARRRLIENLMQRPEIYWMAELWGSYDILFAIQATDMSAFSQSLGALQASHKAILETDIAIRVKVSQFQRTYLWKGKSSRRRFTFTGSGDRKKISPTALTLAQLLTRTPRISIAEIARSLSISRPTVYAHLKELKSSGLLQGITALFKTSSAGLATYHLLLKLRRTDPNSRAEILALCDRVEEITFCIETIGAWQCELCCEVDSHEALQRIVSLVRSSLIQNLIEVTIAPFADYYLKYQFTLQEQ